MEKIKKWNKYFELYHGDSFRLGTRVVGRLANKIKKKETIPLKIIFDFCKLRTIIRINFHNYQTQKNKNLKRKSSDDSERRRVKKLKKIVN